MAASGVTLRNGPSMQAMEAMKIGGTVTVVGGHVAVAEGNELKPKVVWSVVAGYMELVDSEFEQILSSELFVFSI